jgi:hypothetical protein
MENIKNNWFIYSAGILLFLALGFAIWRTQTQRVAVPTTEEVVEVVEEEATTMTEPSEEEELIIVDYPLDDEVVSSPLEVAGEASGTWFFEGEFPIELFDENGQSLATGSVQARGDWMTEDFVVFFGELEFGTPVTDTGVLVLEKANPSGLPKNADELRVPVGF